MIYLKYLAQVAVHRWYVLIECWKFGLWWAPFVHDNSKLSRHEFRAYSNYFMGDKAKWKAAFQYAWNHHQKSNPHHGLYWVVGLKHSDSMEITNNATGAKTKSNRARYEVLRMPMRYLVECYCDWVAAGKAYTGKSDVREWFEKEEATMVLHPDTRRILTALVYAESDEYRRTIIAANKDYWIENF